jgi:hypothetical protein
MKKIYMMVAALPLLMASCGSDDSLTVTPSNAEVKCGETLALTASNKNVTWSSLDADIASVDTKGVVTGKHIGQTRVEAVDNDGNNGSSEITVVASNNNFTAPLTAWNSSIADVRAAMTSWSNITLDTQEEDALTYTTNGTFPMYSYGFDNNGGLMASILAVSLEQDEDLDLMGWLDERYWYLSEVDGDFFYYDANNEASATMMIKYGYNATLDCVTVTWTPKSNTKADGVTRAAESAAFKALRSTLGK